MRRLNKNYFSVELPPVFEIDRKYFRKSNNFKSLSVKVVSAGCLSKQLAKFRPLPAGAALKNQSGLFCLAILSIEHSGVGLLSYVFLKVFIVDDWIIDTLFCHGDQIGVYLVHRLPLASLILPTITSVRISIRCLLANAICRTALSFRSCNKVIPNQVLLASRCKNFLIVSRTVSKYGNLSFILFYISMKLISSPTLHTFSVFLNCLNPLFFAKNVNRVSVKTWQASKKVFSSSSYVTKFQYKIALIFLFSVLFRIRFVHVLLRLLLRGKIRIFRQFLHFWLSGVFHFSFFLEFFYGIIIIVVSNCVSLLLHICRLPRLLFGSSKFVHISRGILFRSDNL